MGSSKRRTLFKRKPNHFNIYSHTTEGFCERSVPCNCPNCWRICYCERGSFVLTGNSIPYARTMRKAYVPTKCLIKSVISSGQKFLTSFHQNPDFRETKWLMWASSSLAPTSIRQRSVFQPVSKLITLQLKHQKYSTTSKNCKVIERSMEWAVTQFVFVSPLFSLKTQAQRTDLMYILLWSVSKEIDTSFLTHSC